MNIKRSNIFNKIFLLIIFLPLQIFGQFIEKKPIKYSMVAMANDDNIPSFDFYEDSSFVFTICDTGCLCIRGHWRIARQHIILTEKERIFNCRDVNEQIKWQKYSKPFYDSIFVTLEKYYFKNDNGEIIFRKNKINIDKVFKSNKKAGFFRGEDFDFIRNLPRLKKQISVLDLPYPHWSLFNSDNISPSDSLIINFLERKYNVKIDFSISYSQHKKNVKHFNLLNWYHIYLDYIKYKSSLDNKMYNTFRRYCGCKD